MSRIIKGGLFFVFLVALWQVIIIFGRWPEFLVPSPLSVLKSFISGINDGSFLRGISASVRRIVVGFGLSIIIGVILGFLIGRIKVVNETLGSFVLGLQTLPSVCWLPIAILWFGLNEKAVIFVVIMGALLAITISTADGVKNISPAYINAARTMGAKGWRLHWNVLLPAALPSVITGMKLGWTFAWRSLMAGELLFISSGGLGFLLQSGRELNDMARVLAVMAIILAIGLFVDLTAFTQLERRVRRRWGIERS